MQETQDDDPEVTAEVKVYVTALQEGIIERLESLISDWARMKRVVAWTLKCKKILISRASYQPSVCTTKSVSPTDLDVSLLEYVQQEVIRLHQQQLFSDHLKDGNTGDRKSLSRISGIYDLDPHIEEKSLLRVRGRLKKSNLHLSDVRPVLLGKDDNIPRLIVEWCHKKVAHRGRGLTISEISSNGFWVVWHNAIVRSLIGKCVKCRLLRGKLGKQKMADLPNDRTLDGPPFTNCGIYIFGPFLIKEGRKELKRYGALLTYLASRKYILNVHAAWIQIHSYKLCNNL